MTHEKLKQLDHQYVVQTYGRFDVDIDHGRGATLYSLDGREYIDFTSGIGVCSIGHANPRWVEAVAAQAAKLGHISNLYYTQPYAQLARTLCERSGMAAAFFGNSGAEGNEGLIKLARKYSFDKYGKGRGTILTLQNSFHGRTMAALTATGQEKLHHSFFPFPDGFRYAEAGSMDALQAAAGHDVCAVLLELVQGEGGVIPLERAYVHDLAVLCAERDWLLLVDEVQTGIGRTGTLFAPSSSTASCPTRCPSPRASPAACPWAAFWSARSAGTCWGRGTTAPPSAATPSAPRRPRRCWTPWTRTRWRRWRRKGASSAPPLRTWRCPAWAGPGAWG